MDKLLPTLILFFSLFVTGCSSVPTNNSDVQVDERDPLESVNRSLWRFTWDYSDKYVTKPLSQAYTNNMPTPIRSGVYNMALNLNEPSTVINHLLQAKFKKAATSTGRFVLNSTIGLLGFFDPASDLGWQRHEEEFGEVLGAYGVSDGAYLVLPVLGPSSVRAEVGDYVDKYYWPLAVIDFWPNLLRQSILGLEARAALAEQESLINNAIDDYEFVKNAYFQSMEFKVFDGNPPVIIDEEEEADIDAYLDELE
jgi:phospholipid-binding lipoprotein MlaA